MCREVCDCCIERRREGKDRLVLIHLIRERIVMSCIPIAVALRTSSQGRVPSVIGLMLGMTKRISRDVMHLRHGHWILESRVPASIMIAAASIELL